MPNSQNTQPKNSLPASRAGCLVLGDIVGFSLMPAEKQRCVVQSIWHYLDQGNKLLVPENEPVMNGTGDGAMIALPNVQRSPRHEEVVKFCTDWIKHHRESDNARLRVGVHIGPFDRVSVSMHGHESIQIVGNGPNHVARVVGFAGDEDVVLSQEFVDSWIGESGEDILRQLKPEEIDRPFTAAVKHDKPVLIRLLKREGSDMPPRVFHLRGIDGRLYELLREVEVAVAAGIAQTRPKDRRGKQYQINEEKLSARISIFVPRPRKNPRSLECTVYRHHRRGEHLQRGTTPYRYGNSPSECHGPIAHAFVSNEPQAVVGLDPPDGASYEDWASRQLGVPIEVVSGFKRKARSFFAIPCSLPFQKSPEVVLCVDNDLPLSKWSLQDIASVLRNVKEKQGELIAAYWKLRY